MVLTIWFQYKGSDPTAFVADNRPLMEYLDNNCESILHNSGTFDIVLIDIDVVLNRI